MPEIVITEFMDERAVASLAAEFDTLYDPQLGERQDEIGALLGEARALVVRNRTRVDHALLAAAPRLRVVGRLGVGLDNIDLAACEERGVAVCPAIGANTDAVAEYVIGGLLVLLRGVYHASEQVLAGEWPRTALLGREVAGKRLGLIGFGAIGRAVARRAQALGMEVAACDPAVETDSGLWEALGVSALALDELLAESHAVSLHVPLSAATRGLIDERALRTMRRGAVLINSARGGIVDERALAAALREGHLAGALLDCFEDEPLPAGSHLIGVPHLLLTPHIGGLTEESNARVGALIAARVREALAPG